jgi:hypothetical protein
MALNLDQIRNRLNSLQTTTSRTNNMYKPQPGKQVVRILPYKFANDATVAGAFIEQYFHYDINKRTYLSPITHGNPDPIQEFAERLKSTGSREDWNLSKKLTPKLRTFAPVVVRGEEGEGVRFWGFGKMVYEELLSILADPDYGDITDPVSGRDVQVEVKMPEETGKSYPTTTIRVKPNQTPVSSDETQMKNWVENQTDMKEIFKENTYDELKEILQNWLNPSDDEQEESVGIEEDTTETTPEEKSSTTKVTNVSDAFDELFNS